MARTDAYSIFIDKAGLNPDELKEAYGGLIEAIQVKALSGLVKNQRLSGDPRAGSVEVQRYATSKSQAYGTSRSNGEGNKVANTGKVTVNTYENKREISEEITVFDVQANTVANLISTRTKDHGDTVVRELDYAFFNKAVAEGALHTFVASNPEGRLEEIIQKVQNVKNDWVDGVPRSMISVFLNTEEFGKIRTYLDNIKGAADEEVGYYHGVRVYSNIRQSASHIAMADGSIAQPVVLNEYEPQRIPLSADMSLYLPFWYGTKAVAPDLIFVAGVESNES